MREAWSSSPAASNPHSSWLNQPTQPKARWEGIMYWWKLIFKSAVSTSAISRLERLLKIAYHVSKSTYAAFGHRNNAIRNFSEHTLYWSDLLVLVSTVSPWSRPLRQHQLKRHPATSEINLCPTETQTCTQQLWMNAVSRRNVVAPSGE